MNRLLSSQSPAETPERRRVADNLGHIGTPERGVAGRSRHTFSPGANLSPGLTVLSRDISGASTLTAYLQNIPEEGEVLPPAVADSTGLLGEDDEDEPSTPPTAAGFAGALLRRGIFGATSALKTSLSRQSSTSAASASSIGHSTRPTAVHSALPTARRQQYDRQSNVNELMASAGIVGATGAALTTPLALSRQSSTDSSIGHSGRADNTTTAVHSALPTARRQQYDRQSIVNELMASAGDFEKLLQLSVPIERTVFESLIGETQETAAHLLSSEREDNEAKIESLESQIHTKKEAFDDANRQMRTAQMEETAARNVLNEKERIVTKATKLCAEEKATLDRLVSLLSSRLQRIALLEYIKNPPVVGPYTDLPIPKIRIHMKLDCQEAWDDLAEQKICATQRKYAQMANLGIVGHAEFPGKSFPFYRRRITGA